MKGNVKQTLLLASLALVLMVSAATFAVAQPWTPGPKVNYDADVHEQLQEAMANEDFAEWKRIREENNLPMHGRMMAEMNEERFGEFVRMHAAYQSGNQELAETIRNELRERNPGMQGKGMQNGKNQVQQGHRQIVSSSQV
jgi:hypothetical protein